MPQKAHSEQAQRMKRGRYGGIVRRIDADGIELAKRLRALHASR